MLAQVVVQRRSTRFSSAKDDEVGQRHSSMRMLFPNLRNINDSFQTSTVASVQTHRLAPILHVYPVTGTQLRPRKLRALPMICLRGCLPDGTPGYAKNRSIFSRILTPVFSHVYLFQKNLCPYSPKALHFSPDPINSIILRASCREL